MMFSATRVARLHVFGMWQKSHHLLKPFGVRMGLMPLSASFSTLGKSLTLPSLTVPADPAKHVFIPLCDIDENIRCLFRGEQAVFVRAGVASGKSTAAEHLGNTFPKQFVKVAFTDGTEVEWRKDLLQAIQKSCPDFRCEKGSEACLADALKHVSGTGLTLVLDEAHTIFAANSLCTLLFKRDPPNRPKVLLFSAAGEAASTTGELVATPSELTQKYMWTPPMPNASVLKAPLAKADIKLSVESIEFFLRFCGGHRGIFIAAMHWVLKRQGKEPEGRAEWNLGTTVGKVRSSFGEEDWSEEQILGVLAK